MAWKNMFVVVLTACMFGCGSGSGGGVTPIDATVSITGASTPINIGASRTFTATVNHASNAAVSWSVVEAGGGSITQAGVYTAPLTPGTYTVKATAQANPSSSATAPVTVVIPRETFPATVWVSTTTLTAPTSCIPHSSPSTTSLMCGKLCAPNCKEWPIAAQARSRLASGSSLSLAQLTLARAGAQLFL